VSVVTLPRRPLAPDVRRAPVEVARPATRRRARRRRSTSVQRAVGVLAAALAISLFGSMLVANRQVEIHQLQSRLLSLQSNYAEQVGSLTNSNAPSAIARAAGQLHLVDPVTVTQVPATSLDAPLPLPKFVGYAPVTSRTSR
jgi:hypothetical protein